VEKKDNQKWKKEARRRVFSKTNFTNKAYEFYHRITWLKKEKQYSYNIKHLECGQKRKRAVNFLHKNQLRICMYISGL